MANDKKANPDNRRNNVERLHDMIENTQNKLQESEVSLEFASLEEREFIEQKNNNRIQSIGAMNQEMKEEMDAREKGEY